MANRNLNSTSKSSSANWTSSFQISHARRPSNLAICTMTACALLLPLAATHRVDAESSTPNTPTISVLVPETSPFSSLKTPLAPAPSLAAPTVKTPTFASIANAATSSGLAPITAVVADKTQKGFILPSNNMTVGEALNVMGVSLSKLDRAQPDAADKFASGMTVRVTRVTIENKTRREAIAAGVRYQPTTSLLPGVSKTTQYPQTGYREITEKVYTKNGVETLRKAVSTKIGQAPKNRIISLGVASRFMPQAIKPHKRYAKALSYRGGGPRDRSSQTGGAPTLRIAKTFKMNASAYQGAEVRGGGMRTATGMRVGYGAIAVDPRVIPLGSKLYIEGYGYGFACDTGGAIKGHKIDLAMPTIAQCNAYGRKRGVTVHILSE